MLRDLYCKWRLRGKPGYENRYVRGFLWMRRLRKRR